MGHAAHEESSKSVGTHGKGGEDETTNHDGNRSYAQAQEDRWNANIEALSLFKEQHGHVNVPQRPTKLVPNVDHQLGTFCRNLRSQYKYLQNEDTKHLSFLTEERIEQLESMGFVWDTRKDLWFTRYDELCDFARDTGHTNVPAKYNPGSGRS